MISCSVCVCGSVFLVFFCGLGAGVSYVFLWVVFLHKSPFFPFLCYCGCIFSCILFIIFFYTCHMLLLLCKTHYNEMCHSNKSALPCPIWVLRTTPIIVQSCHNHTVTDSLLKEIILYSIDSKKTCRILFLLVPVWRR